MSKLWSPLVICLVQVRGFCAGQNFKEPPSPAPKTLTYILLWMEYIQNFGHHSAQPKTRALVYTTPSVHGLLTWQGRRAKTVEEGCNQRRGQIPSSGRFSHTMAGSKILMPKARTEEMPGGPQLTVWIIMRCSILQGTEFSQPQAYKNIESVWSRFFWREPSLLTLGLWPC